MVPVYKLTIVPEQHGGYDGHISLAARVVVMREWQYSQLLIFSPPTIIETSFGDPHKLANTKFRLGQR